MPARTESVAYVALGALTLAAVGFLLLLGPVGWLLAALLLAAVYALARWSGLTWTTPSAAAAAKVSCPDCGARNDADRGACHHCGEPLPGA